MTMGSFGGMGSQDRRLTVSEPTPLASEPSVISWGRVRSLAPRLGLGNAVEKKSVDRRTLLRSARRTINRDFNILRDFENDNQ